MTRSSCWPLAAKTPLRVGRFCSLICVLAVIALVAWQAPLVAEETPKNRLYWHPDLLLTWDDFQSDIPSDNPPNTSCAIFLTIHWHCSYELRPIEGEAGFLMSVSSDGLVSRAYMRPLQSWVDDPNDKSLTYMTLLFDIEHVFALQLRECLLALTAPVSSAAEANALLHSFAKPVLEECAHTIAQCEEETAHGTLTEQIANWRELVDEWMDSPDL
jgi:hypothetical protein